MKMIFFVVHSFNRLTVVRLYINKKKLKNNADILFLFFSRFFIKFSTFPAQVSRIYRLNIKTVQNVYILQCESEIVYFFRVLQYTMERHQDTTEVGFFLGSPGPGPLSHQFLQDYKEAICCKFDCTVYTRNDVIMFLQALNF